MALQDDGHSVCPLPVGVGPPNNCPTAYFNRSIPYGPNNSAFSYVSHWTSAPQKPFEWQPERHAPAMDWPPRGLVLNVNFTAPKTVGRSIHQDVVVTLHFEMYQGIPAFSKSLTVSFGQIENRQVLLNDSQSHGTGQKKQHNKLMVPKDEQGNINIHDCNVSLPPSNWESRWILSSITTFPQQVKMYGSQNLCLSVTSGTLEHSFNDNVDVRPCNTTDSLQQWVYNASENLLLTQATPADLACINMTDCGITYPSVACQIDINNHQDNPGTTCQMLTVNNAGVKWNFVTDSIYLGNTVSGQYRCDTFMCSR